MQRLRRLWFVNDFIVFVAVLAAGFARNYFWRYQGRREEAVRLQAQAAQLQAQLADARLSALRMQLNPHFLFNTLHAVSALVERDPRGVRRMIARLSELLRTSLDEADEPEVPLQRELTFTERYLDVIQIRFQGHLQVEMHADDNVRDALVPNLILQPLVENAIKHGISKLSNGGHIEVCAIREGERVIITVRDNGPEVSLDQTPSPHSLGLAQHPRAPCCTVRPAPEPHAQARRRGWPGRRGLPALSHAVTAPGLRVLIVDDEALGRQRLEDLLRHEGRGGDRRLRR